MTNSSVQTPTDKNRDVSEPLTKKQRVNQSVIHIHKHQQRNPLLRFVRSVPYTVIDNLVPDYSLGESACAVFISIKYHLLYPSHVLRRMKEVGKEGNFQIKILLCLVSLGFMNCLSFFLFFWY